MGVLIVLGLAVLYSCVKEAPPPAQKIPMPRPYKIDGKWYHPIPDARGFTQKGLASWYGKDFHGKKTANGEIYDMHAMTAAHKTLPLGTRVRVYNLTNGKICDVRVNDRGPFVRGRIIDLSYSAAKEIGLVGPGVAKVRIKAMAPPAGAVQGDRNVYYKGNFTIQVGAFKSQANAENLVKKLSGDYNNAHLIRETVGDDIFYRVRVGQCSTLEQAAQFQAVMQGRGYPNAFVVAE
ncbi:MAG: septal ring lytic transglycosylase RlpA family protein [Desulfatibacillum sp.]|nr:septal ring lytic transglycosylase RlpA family protein [Desulfatibacillum sp.]